MNKNKSIALSGLLLIASFQAAPAFADSPKLDQHMVKQGRYIARIAGCNDCHTRGYIPNNGNVPEKMWLSGDNFGWRGPWGTTYGSNLRLFVKDMSEDDWVKVAKTLNRKPPMPWFNLNDMKESDLRALYQFMKSLGDPGKPAPAFVPPDKEPKPPYATFPAPPAK
jgi:mono/diheme cytochrome c family protein